MAPENLERRSHYRCDFANPIEYVLNEMDSVRFKGATINSSATGICFFSYSPIRENDTVMIVKTVLPLPYSSGTVRWVKKVDSDFYKVGLMFARNSGPGQDGGPDKQHE